MTRATPRLRRVSACVAIAALPLLAVGAVLPEGHDKANVVIVVTHEFAFDIPPSIPAGLTTFELRNRGKLAHHMGVMRLDSGHTAADGLAALIKAGRGVRPAWLHSVGGPQAAMPGESANATLVLEPGNYLAYCEIPGPDPARHYMKGMIKPFTVIPPSRPGTLPAADIAIDLVDFDFVLSRPLTRGPHVIAISNSAHQPHMVAIKRYSMDHPAGTAASELTAWALDPQGKLGPGDNEGGVTEIPPGATVTMTRNIRPGRYLLICFSADATDGKPHFKHGMQKEIIVQ
jgi:uncharacterized cupredoxin-like copper-binding protein